MNGNAMRKKLGPVADDIAMFLSGIDGFPHDLRDFSAVGARTWTVVVLVRTFGTWRRFIWGIILIAVAGVAGFL